MSWICSCSYVENMYVEIYIYRFNLKWKTTDTDSGYIFHTIYVTHPQLWLHSWLNYAKQDKNCCAIVIDFRELWIIYDLTPNTLGKTYKKQSSKRCQIYIKTKAVSASELFWHSTLEPPFIRPLEVSPWDLAKSRNHEISFWNYQFSLKFYERSLQQCCRDTCPISDQCNHFNTQYRVYRNSLESYWI